MRILAIGNSFSEDCATYLHDIGKTAGVSNRVVNLYVPRCTLERHWRNIEFPTAEYQYQLNGERSELYTSISNVLENEEFDIILTQQASAECGWVESYEPFLGNMVRYIREKAPSAELCLNQTWAYEKDSTHKNFCRYNRDINEMYERLTKAYTGMAHKYGLTLIPSGKLIQDLRKTKCFGEERSICRDGFHMDKLYGRYAVGCMWARCLLKVPESAPVFSPPDADSEIIDLIRKTVYNV